MGLVGNLKDLQVSNLIQINCVEGNTAQLSIKSGGRSALVFFDRGEIVHACYGEMKGEQALYKILRFTDGEFRVIPGGPIPERTIFSSWKGLLLEGMRVMDESDKARETVVETLGETLRDAKDIEGLLIVSSKGDTLLCRGFEDAEGMSVVALRVARETATAGARLNFGPTDYFGVVTGSSQYFFFPCDSHVVVVRLDREVDVEPIAALMDTIRSRLKYSELRPGVGAEAGAGSG